MYESTEPVILALNPTVGIRVVRMPTGNLMMQLRQGGLWTNSNRPVPVVPDSFYYNWLNKSGTHIKETFFK